MKLKRHLGIIMMTAFMLVISMTMITAAADTVKCTFNPPEGSVYLLVREQEITPTTTPVESLSLSGTVSCENFTVLSLPDPADTNKRLQLDCYLFKAGESVVVDLPDGEYYFVEFFNPIQPETPALNFHLMINHAWQDPVSINAHIFEYSAKTGVNEIDLTTSNVFWENAPINIAGCTEKSQFYVNVQNEDGDRLEGIIVNLELENSQGEMEVVERTVSSSSGRAIFTTDISDHKGKCVVSVTDSVDYATKVELDITDIVPKLTTLQRDSSSLYKQKKLIPLVEDANGDMIPQTSDTAYIKKLLSEQFSQKIPEVMSWYLYSANNFSTLEYKGLDGIIPTYEYALAREKDAVLKLGNVDKVPIQLKKIDVAGKELPGAQMELFRQKPALQNGQVVQVEESIAQWTSSETAKAFDVAPGTYRIHEVAAPKGYELAADITFTIDKDGVVQSSTVDSVVTVNGVPTILMEDPKTPPEDPKTPPKDPKTDNPPTGDDNNALAFMLLMALSCAGIAVTDKKIKKYNR